MKINVHAGHNQYSTGASSILDELKENRKVTPKVIELLKENGHTVYDCTDNDGKDINSNLSNIIKKCNTHDVDLDISIHLNSGRNDVKGDEVTGGVEVWIYSDTSKAKPYATNICKEISNALNVHNRGVKVSGNNLYITRFTNAPSLLIECVFVDDKDDAERWNAEKCAKAIVAGIIGKQPTNNPTPAPKPSVTKIDEDGYWGIKTTKLAQKVFGTEVDGVISNQYKMYQIKNPGLQSDTWQWMDSPGTAGSQLIKAIQRWVGASVNGYGGPETFSKMQRKLGTAQDGIVSSPSQMIKAFQKYLNKQ